MAKKNDENTETNIINENEEIKTNEEGKVVTEKIEDNKTQKNEVKQASNNEDKKVSLKVIVPFTDKYDEEIKYTVNDILNVDKKRADELLSDKRKLVTLA